MDKIISFVTDAIYPPACPVCGKPAPVVGGKRLTQCLECINKIKLINNDGFGKSATCAKCGKILHDEEELCYDCRRISHEYNQCAAAVVYTDEIKKSIYRFKYKNKREYASWYAELIYKQCGLKIKLWEPDVIIPIPLHKAKQKARGYNQAQLVAKELSHLTGIRMDDKLLVRQKNTKPLKTLDEDARIKNLKNAFNITSNVVKYKKVLLVDDIYTTGATIDSCASILKDSGAIEVYGVSICIGNGI